MTGPRFLGLTAAAFGVLGSWDDGAGGVRVAVLENASARESGGGVIGYRFRPVVVANYADIFPPAAPVADLPEPDRRTP